MDHNIAPLSNYVPVLQADEEFIKEDWTKSFKFCPGITTEIIDKRLVKEACSLTKNVSTKKGPKNYRHKNHGYRFGKEGYVRNSFF